MSYSKCLFKAYLTSRMMTMMITMMMTQFYYENGKIAYNMRYCDPDDVFVTINGLVSPWLHHT